MSTPVPHVHADTQTREQWLEKAIEVYFRPLFAQLDYTMPERIHVSVGWGVGQSRATQETANILATCWSGTVSADSFPHIFISPTLVKASEVLATLAHELVHATLDPEMSHGKDFRTLAEKIGLVGRMTATVADSASGAEYMLLAEESGELGPYPHSAIDLSLVLTRAPKPELVPAGGAPLPKISSGPKPQSNRWVRVSCPDHRGAPTVRTSRKSVAEGRAPLCGENDESGMPCAMRMTIHDA
jgi:hypothetical protein